MIIKNSNSNNNNEEQTRVPATSNQAAREPVLAQEDARAGFPEPVDDYHEPVQCRLEKRRKPIPAVAGARRSELYANERAAEEVNRREQLGTFELDERLRHGDQAGPWRLSVVLVDAAVRAEQLAHRLLPDALSQDVSSQLGVGD